MRQSVRIADAKEKVILVVDDDSDVIYLLSEYLSSYGYRVISANSGKMAQTIAYNYKPDLILSDINMPDGNGLNLLHQVKSKFPEIPFFFITGKHGVRKDSCLNQGALDIIRKPFDLKALVEQLEMYFYPESYFMTDEQILSLPEKEVTYFWPNISQRGNQLMLGVKGLFIPSTNFDEEREPKVRLKINFEDRQWCNLEFVGKIVWKRKNPEGNFLAGTGIEILQFIKGEKWYRTYIEKNKIVSTIPIGLSYR